MPSSLGNKVIELHSGPPVEPAIVQHETLSHKDFRALGKIDSNNPTVSYLLKNHPDLKEQMWQLLGNEINTGKPYDRIVAGTEIQLNSETMEIVWNDNAAAATVATAMLPAVDHVPMVKPTTTEQLN